MLGMFLAGARSDNRFDGAANRSSRIFTARRTSRGSSSPTSPRVRTVFNASCAGIAPGDQYGRKGVLPSVDRHLPLRLGALGPQPHDDRADRLPRGSGARCGGLMVGARAIVGDIRLAARSAALTGTLRGRVRHREHHRPPLARRRVVDQLSWHWIFYIQHSDRRSRSGRHRVPGSGSPRPRSPRDDYRGTALLVLSASLLVLFTSLGGTTYAWGSPLMLAFVVAGAVALVAFVLVERRAVEPVLPLHLFSNAGSRSPASSASSSVRDVRSITYLPVFFQIVHGESPTVSGLQTVAAPRRPDHFSTGSGLVISRTDGRYPAVSDRRDRADHDRNPAVVAGWRRHEPGRRRPLHVRARRRARLRDAGARADRPERGALRRAGCRHLGGHPSSARSADPSGRAIFGAIFSNVLVGNLAKHLGKARLPGGLASSSVTPAILDKLPHRGASRRFPAAYAESIQTVFIIAAPIGAVAFLAVGLIPRWSCVERSTPHKPRRPPNRL